VRDEGFVGAFGLFDAFAASEVHGHPRTDGAGTYRICEEQRALCSAAVEVTS
jgi:hypothetical protein